ncbi:NAD-glutamate dehydrogenase [Nocardioides marmoriginsengisoli]|uniref:NAD-glutamate dehydrogenase n=1 Tax=Nocardioides marmoriginsengisoli TaxID=661483 RepID=A0A3N0CJ83_9ACTN|nr:NAD-glutamate dehydrogenase [Nocardioides marmoriginsengisoli]RNL63076.1 NAD-glutamate dehydrogenase [Nocardioides marmoriginsengisoli]
MPTSPDDSRSDLITRLCRYAESRPPAGPAGLAVGDLLRAYYLHAAYEDLAERDEVDLYGAAAHHLRSGTERPQGTATVRILTPTVPIDGWSAGGHTVVEVVTDDMPFLVDSVTMALDQAGHGVHLVIHPQLVVRRDVAGHLQEVLGVEHGATEGHDVGRESWMHLEIDRIGDDEIPALAANLEKVLTDVREAVEDWRRMHDRLDALVAELEADPPVLPEGEVEQGVAFLRWLGEDHFTFLGYREYALAGHGETLELEALPGTGFGILRSDPTAVGVLPPLVAAKAREKTLLVLAKANARATVHRPVRLDYVGIKKFDDAGEVVGERRFLGLFSSAAYTESVTRIPLAREKAKAVIADAGFEPMSHAGKAMLDVLETYPRDELFQTPVAELVPIATTVMHTRERRQLKLFVRRDVYGRYWSVLVYLPKDRYNTAVRERIAAILTERLHGSSIEFTANIGDSYAARLHFVVRPSEGDVVGEVDVADLERRCAETARSWTDDFGAAVIAEYGEEQGSRLARRYAGCFPEAYKEDYPARTGAADIGRLEALDDGADGIGLSLYQEVGAPEGEARLKVYRVGAPLSLSEVLPVLTAMGVEVVDERPYELEGLPRPSFVYDFGLRYRGGLPQQARDLFQDTVLAVWDGRNEVDGFNALVLSVGITWRQAVVLRAYARHMQQGNSPFAQATIEEALRVNVDITRLLVQLFEARFSPDGTTACAEFEERIVAALEDVSSLDHDRILRSYLTWITATLRTNFFQTDAGGLPHPYLSLKLDPGAIPDLPEPRPRFEIFVYSPRVEGVHLRFGAVARGGLRWSDRRDDFRSEVLGLVKAQMVKNTVIVPVGAKGGFYAKQMPDPADRDAWMAEGIACYRTFISGLLDVTDNLVDGPDGRTVVPPAQVVRHDADDTYLVVAADKGTATFSDIANAVSAEYGFWLGDAFASGGSVGYDHKAMGITARGAWVSVRRHFRELGVDCQTEDFTCVGIGDMSGDVFGNGLLCSEHTLLVAAFDHRDIFLDPSPDPAASYAERRRLFDLPRSSWKDYDTALISAGGGVFPRSAKSIPLSPEVRAVLGVEASAMTPAELMRAILLAPVDLLWNGGIGTYVKAAAESDADAADKANDAIRVDGGDLRVRCVGEGGNLGFTQRGRIEFALTGGRINTDFIDNSAGVDTSDHEVNIKILLDKVVGEGDLTGKQRNELLASMTDEVGDLVLADNYDQNLALANAGAQAPALLHVHEDWMRSLEAAGLLNRELEALPSRREVAARIETGEGLSGPELAVLLSYTKIVLADQLLESAIADDPFLRGDLYRYFPTTMRQDYRTAMEAHPLRREIVVTQLVNQLVNGAGMTYVHRLAGETSASTDQLALANFVSREIFGAAALNRQINALDNQLDAEVQTRVRLEVRTLVERASRWLVNNRRLPLDSEAVVEEFEVTVEKVTAALPELMTGLELAAFEARSEAFVAIGVPADLAAKVAACPPAYMVLGIVQTAARADADPLEVARLHFALAELLGLPGLVTRILALPRRDRWQTMARAALRDDLHSVHAQLTGQALDATDLEAWRMANAAAVERAAATFAMICADEDADLARMSVALRVLRSLVEGP